VTDRAGSPKRPAMSRLRAFVRRNPALAALIVALALVLRAVVPGGFMPSSDHRQIVVAICTGSGPATAVIAVPLADSTDTGDHVKGDKPCAFGTLSLTSLAAADAVLLALALLFALALSLRPMVPARALSAPFLRPHLRGPPALS
jgi:hypothetical protein